MVISSTAKGKLISNNISTSQAIIEGVSNRVSGTVDNTKKQISRQSGNSAVDHDTKRTWRNAERVGAPVASIMLERHYKNQVNFYQKVADEYVKKHNIGNDMTERFNKMGMAARSYDPNPDAFGVKRSEVNANMNEQYSVNAKTAEFMKYENGARVPSAKNTIATFHADETGGGYIEVKHLRGVGETKHINYEACRTALYQLKVLRDQGPLQGKDIDTYNRLVRNAKDAGMLSFLGKYQNRSARKMDMCPRKLSRQLLRLASTPVEQSESMKGVHMMQTTSMVLKSGSKIAVHTGVGFAGNVLISGVRAATFVQTLRGGGSFKTSFTMMRQMKHRTYGSLKADVKKKISSTINNAVLKSANQMGPRNYGKFLTKHNRIRNALESTQGLLAKRASIMEKNGFVRRQAKTELKTMYREAFKGAFDKGFQKAMPKTHSKVHAISDGAKDLSKKATEAIAKKFNPARLALEKAKGKLAKSTIGKFIKAIREVLDKIKLILGPVFAALGAVVFVFVVIALLCCFYDGNQAAQKQNQAFIISQKDGESIMNALENQHQKELDKIQAIAAKYDTADIQYPSGSNENYKELFCAIQVQLEYDLSLTNNKYKLTNNGNPTLMELADGLYEQTHIITETPYEFKYDDGTVGTACHIYIDIQRNETLAYSIFEGQVPSDVYASADSSIAPSGTCDTTNWMEVCLTVKTLIAQAQPQYNQSGWMYIKVNEKPYHVRTDCSGYVSTCLQVYGATAGVYGTGQLISDQHFAGFTYMTFPGWDNLQQGDILVRRFKSKDSSGSYADAGHTEIFYANSGGQHLVFSNGSTAGIRAIYPRNDSVAAYDIIYRPTAAGSIDDSTDTAIDEVTNPDQKFIFRNWSRSFGENALLLASNMDDITIDPTTGNEAGFDTAIQATVAAGEFKPSSYVDYLTEKNKQDKDGSGHPVHYVGKGNTFKEASSLDYIRYICAQHGVCADYNYDNMITNTYNTVDAAYSPVVDNTIKRTNSGINVDLNSTESMEDAPLLQSPHAFTTGMDDLGNLQVGDIMFYVWDTGAWTSNYDDTDYNTWAVGTGRFYDALDHSIPMMYIGDGNFTCYVRTGSNVGAVRTLNVSELEQNRCLNKKIIRYIGFTVSPVYGATPSFCGWTDNKIGELIVLQNGAQWTEGKIHLAAYGMTESEEKELTDQETDEDIKEWNDQDAINKQDRGEVLMSPYDSVDVDYSFYKEDIFEGDIYTPTDSHKTTLYDEVCDIALKNYEIFGILPSTAYCHMGAASHFRSTEESLKYYNLFEMTNADGPGVNKYSYTKDGDASTSITNYKLYSSYKAAFQDWVLYAKLHGYTIDSDYTETFKEQRDQYTSHGLISGDIASQMTEIYENAPDLEQLDKDTMERKEAIDNVVDAMNTLKDMNLTTTSPKQQDYYDYCDAASNLAAYIEKLDDVLSDHDSATEHTNQVLENAVKAWETADENAKKAYQYYEDNKDTEYTSKSCGGHYTRQVFDPIRHEYVDDTTSPKTPCSDINTCSNPKYDTENWDEHHKLDWTKPTYENIYVE